MAWLNMESRLFNTLALLSTISILIPSNQHIHTQTQIHPFPNPFIPLPHHPNTTTHNPLIPTNTALISSLSPTPRSPSPAACESSGSSSRRPSRTPPSARFHSPAPRSLHVTHASPLPVGRSSVRTTILSTSFASSKEPSARTDRSTPPISSTRIHANRFASKPHPSRSS